MIPNASQDHCKYQKSPYSDLFYMKYKHKIHYVLIENFR